MSAHYLKPLSRLEKCDSNVRLIPMKDSEYIQGSSPENEVPRTAAWVMAALPYVGLQLFYMTQPDEWEYLTCYGINCVAIPAVLITWVILLIIEWKLRNVFSARLIRAPWFSMTGLILLIVFQVLRPTRYPVDFTEQKARLIGTLWMAVLLFAFSRIAGMTLPSHTGKEPNKTNGR